jgi:hypothetical protein
MIFEAELGYELLGLLLITPGTQKKESHGRVCGDDGGCCLKKDIVTFLGAKAANHRQDFVVGGKTKLRSETVSDFGLGHKTLGIDSARDFRNSILGNPSRLQQLLDDRSRQSNMVLKNGTVKPAIPEMVVNRKDIMFRSDDLGPGPGREGLERKGSDKGIPSAMEVKNIPGVTGKDATQSQNIHQERGSQTTLVLNCA